MNLRTFLALALIWATGLSLSGQQLKVPDAAPREAQFSYTMAEVSFVSDAVFMGRRDTVAAPYLLPSFGVYHKSGFFADASISYLLAAGENRIDLALVSAGYSTAGERWSGGLSATAYFFSTDSYNVQAETSASLTALLGYDFKAVELLGSLNAYFGAEQSTDLFMGITLQRNFSSANLQWHYQPQVSLYAGSQHFYQAYYNTSRLGNRKGSGAGSRNATQALTLADATRFRILNIEAGMAIDYFTGHWILSLNPYLALPQSPASLTGPDISYTEALEPVFYFTTGISFWW
ncbi:hypothetical protein OZ410_09040 [Robiginitalea sp. M366]|uniref:hypothetical protein n=1 Tax=Robiginitalea aestuariiviva TaxID=3036903 RepID=UPI00240D5733|nr:hypothetical protein [Robiginitalea aestuariiviva]MDG1572459.1 hypothetical protein [Robiginitalea aestuariiviva]